MSGTVLKGFAIIFLSDRKLRTKYRWLTNWKGQTLITIIVLIASTVYSGIVNFSQKSNLFEGDKEICNFYEPCYVFLTLVPTACAIHCVIKNINKKMNSKIVFKSFGVIGTEFNILIVGNSVLIVLFIIYKCILLETESPSLIYCSHSIFPPSLLAVLWWINHAAMTAGAPLMHYLFN
jgi:hypothetical protein